MHAKEVARTRTPEPAVARALISMMRSAAQRTCTRALAQSSTWLNPRAAAASAAVTNALPELRIPEAMRVPAAGASASSAAQSADASPLEAAAESIRSIGAQLVMPGDRRDDEELWASLAGGDDVRRAVTEQLLLPLAHPAAFESVRAHTRADRAEPARPLALLFHGPPGTGKTQAARLAAEAAGLPLVACPLESIVSKYYGDSEKLLAALFASSRALGPCVLFLDEIDALGGNRAAREVHEASRRMLSVLLRHLDGIDAAPSSSVALIAATNRPHDLDRALLSRFEARVDFPPPGARVRALIFGRYARHLPASGLASLGEAADGLTGRDVLSICKQAERRFVGGQLVEQQPIRGGPPIHLYEEAISERLRLG